MQYKISRIFVFCVLITGFLFVSCGGDEETDPEEVAMNDELLLQAYFTSNNINPQKTASGLYYVIDEPGTSDRPTRSSQVTVNYRGYFLNDEEFDSSFSRGEPSTFSLRGVIPGWTEGIPLFGIGGKGSLYIPSRLGYGPDGSASGIIQGDTPIAFDIELISFQ